MSMFNTPKAPDPSQALAQGQMVANQQQALNNQTAAGAQASSMVNQENPYGSLTYRQTGTSPYGTPIYTANMQLNPEQQALFDQLTQTKGAAGNQAYNLLSGANYGSSQPSDAIGSLTSGLTGQLVDKYKTYIDPFQQTERDRLDTQLRNQGLAPGMPGYDNALRQLDTSHSLANSKAVADYENQAFGQASQLYSLPAMLGLQLAGFGQPGDVKNDLVQAPAYNANPANLIGATANAQDWQQQQYQNQLNSQSNAMQGLFGIGSAALGGWAKAGFPGASQIGSAAMTALPLLLSDRRFKKNIKQVGYFGELPVYEFNYVFGGPKNIGFMADEVELVVPSAVTEFNGVKFVNYEKVLNA